MDETVHRCRRCGRKISNPVALERGYGRRCWSKKWIQQELPFEDGEKEPERTA